MVYNIGAYAFKYCGLISLIIPTSVKLIGEVEGYSDKEIVIIINYGCKFQGAFFGNLNLQNVLLPTSLSEISPLLFMECISLTSIEIPT